MISNHYEKLLVMSTLMPETIRQARYFLLVFLVFSLPLLISPFNSSYPYVKGIYALFMSSFLLLLWAAEMILRGRHVLRLPPLSLPLFGMLAAAALSMVNARNLPAGLSSFILIWSFGALYLLVTHTLRTRREGEILLYSLLSSSGLISLYALLQYTGALPSPLGTEARTPEAMIATLGNVNYVAALLSGLLVVGLALLLQKKPSIGAKMMILIGLGLALATLALARSEGSWVNVIASLLFFAVISFRRRRWRLQLRRISWAILLLAGLMGIVYASTSLSLFSTAVFSSSQLDSSSQREIRSLQLRLWNSRVSWEMLRDHPWFGVGLGGYKLEFLKYKAKLLRTEWGRSQGFRFYIPRSEQAHNEYIQVAAEMGMVGIAALAWAVFMLVSGMIRTSNSLNILQVGLSSGVVAFLVDGLYDFPFHRPTSALVLVVLIGLLHSRGIGSRKEALILRLRKGKLATLIVGFLLIASVVGILTYRDLRGDFYVEAGRRDLQFGRLQAAKAKLEQGVRWSLQPAFALFQLGKVHHELGDYEQAIEALERSLRGRVSEETYLLLAQAYLERGEDEPAWKYVQQLLATEPHPLYKVPAYYVRAELFRRRGDRKDALAQLSHVLRLQPDYLKAYTLTAEIYRELGDLKSARDFYHRGLQTAQELREEIQLRLRAALYGPGLAAGEWRRLLQEIGELDRTIDEIQRALRALMPSSPGTLHPLPL